MRSALTKSLSRHFVFHKVPFSIHLMLFCSGLSGWFYYLQDSGTVGKTIKSVDELSVLRPKAFLVRSAIPCYRRAPGRLKHRERVYVREQVEEGEVLNFDCVHTEAVERTKPACCFLWLFGKKTQTYVTDVQYLRCADLDGREVLLEFGQEGTFSPVGDPGTTSDNDVYQLHDIVRCSDLPTHMKLCWGLPPSTPCSFTGLLRLEDVYFEETIIACTLGAQRHTMVEFPTDSEIQFILASDAYRYIDHPVIQKAMSHCTDHVDSYVNSIKVVQSFYPDHIKLPEPPSREKGRTEVDLPPLPPPGTDGSTIGSLATTDDFTDDSEFSDYTEDEERASHVPVTQGPATVISSDLPANTKAGPEVDEDPNYEVIPVDRAQASRVPPPVLPEGNMMEEDDYLQPLPVNNYARVKLERKVNHPETIPLDKPCVKTKPRRWSDMDVDISNGHPRLVASVSDTNSLQNHNTSRPDSRMSDQNYSAMTEMIGRHLKERLDAFLTDSLQELHRLKTNGQREDRDTSSVEYSVPRKPKIAPKPKHLDPQIALQSHENIHAFLDSIFDPDTMEGEENNSDLSKMVEVRQRPSSVIVTSETTSSKRPPYKFSLSHPDATLRKHNMKSIHLVRPNAVPGTRDDLSLNLQKRGSVSDHVRRPDHLPVLGYLNPAFGQDDDSSPLSPDRDKTFIPISHLDSDTPPRGNSNSSSSADYPRDQNSSPERDFSDRVNARADSGIFVSPRISDFHLDLESPYRAPSEEPSWSPPDDLSTLSVTDIAHCLRYIGMKDKLVYRFVEEQIDGKLLLELDSDLLREGFPGLNALERKKILDFIGGWRPKKL